VASLVGSPEDEPSRPSLRLRVVGLTVLVLFGVLVLRLWTLQVIDGKSYAAAVNANQVRIVSVQAPRGEIVDRNDTVLVGNVPQEEVLLSRQTALQDKAIIGDVAALVGQTPAEVNASVNNNRYSPYEPVPVAQNVSPSVVEYIQLHGREFPGVTVQSVTQRIYPQGGTTGTHILGYLGDISAQYLKDNPNAGYTQGSQVGVSGVEAQYEQYLRGINGRQALSVNASGTVVGTLSRQSAQLGDTVVLNVDTGLQEEVQKDLQAQILLDQHTPDTESGRIPPAPDGAVIVMNPSNGQIYAMSSFPTYDLNDFVGGISQANYSAIAATGAENDRAIDGQYTPGSTFKLITATAALQDGLYSAGEYYDDTLTFKVPNCIGGTCTFHDDPGDGGGEVNLSGALTVSSDSYFYNLGALFWSPSARQKFGDQAIQNVGAEYGEGELTGIDLPGEAQGRIDSQVERLKLHKESPAGFPHTTWYTGDNVEMAFGQGATALTPIEQATAYATFANGGTRYAPEVASAVVDPTTGKVVQQFAPKVTGHVSLPASIFDPILQGLEGVISNPKGTAFSDFQGFPADFHLAGKTGTASNEASEEPNSWFVAFGPNPNPQYLVLAVIDQGGYGAQAAAPLVRSIFNYIYANPIGAVKRPTKTVLPSSVAPTTIPPLGTPTTTTTSTTTPGTTATTGPTTTTSTTSTTTPVGG
jgi:penicillin-binding protein 2